MSNKSAVQFDDVTLDESNNVEFESGVYTTTLRDIPKALRERFKKLKKEGKVSGSLNTFFIQCALDRVFEIEK